MSGQTIMNMVFAVLIVFLIVAQFMSENKEEKLEEEVGRLKDHISALRHKSHIHPSELDAVKQKALGNEKHIKQLLEQLGKKLKATSGSEQTVYYEGGYETYTTYDCEVVDLTDAEKRAKELRQEAERLEREDQ